MNFPTPSHHLILCTISTLDTAFYIFAPNFDELRSALSRRLQATVSADMDAFLLFEPLSEVEGAKIDVPGIWLAQKAWKRF